MSFARWLENFEPDIPDLDFDLTDLPTDPLLLSATREEWAAMELAALVARGGGEAKAEEARAIAGYANLNGHRETYWPHDNDPED